MVTDGNFFQWQLMLKERVKNGDIVKTCTGKEREHQFEGNRL